MGERKVLNKYIPSDFDPKLVPRGTKPKDDLVTVRMMLPFTIQCSTCSTVSFVAVWSLYHFLLVFRRSPSIRLFSPPPTCRASWRVVRNSHALSPFVSFYRGPLPLAPLAVQFCAPARYNIRIYTRRGRSEYGQFLYRGRKFNSKKESMKGIEGKYLGIQRFRFYIKCSDCSRPITFREYLY